MCVVVNLGCFLNAPHKLLAALLKIYQSQCIINSFVNKCREGSHPEHCTKLHITNCGKFDLHVRWELRSQPTPATPPVSTGKAAAKPRAASATKEAAAQAAAAPIFLFEPKVRHSLLP